MKGNLCIQIVVAAFLPPAVTTSPLAASEGTEARLRNQPKVSKSDGENTALGKVPNGGVESAEVEKEHGKLVWSFDIANPNTENITEVQVDAKTDRIAAVAKETPKASSPFQLSLVPPVVIEIADGLLREETAAFLQSLAFTKSLSAWLLASSDPLADGVFEPLAICGLISMSPLGMREARAATEISVLPLKVAAWQAEPATHRQELRQQTTKTEKTGTK